MIKPGDKLPAGTLNEFIEVEGDGCSLGPNSFDIAAATAGKTLAIFALPGAFTPTCSAKHVSRTMRRRASLTTITMAGRTPEILLEHRKSRKSRMRTLMQTAMVATT